MKKIKKAVLLLAVMLLSGMLFAGNSYGASYTVAKNDSLYKIGLLYNTTADAIMADNKLTGSTIYPGQVLYVRSGAYTVKIGDTLYLIAQKHGLSLENLRRINNKWDDIIYPGVQLVVPLSGNNPLTSAGGSGSVIPYTQSEFDLLARLVTAEADSEPYQAQVAVAAVVVNRVKSDLFPDSISSVIYQISNGFYQFTPVENGWINRPASQTSKAAAQESLAGNDPSKGALFYFDDSATNKWLRSKPIRARIGHMVYVY